MYLNDDRLEFFAHHGCDGSSSAVTPRPAM
jgi:hypothetical protein